MIRWKDSAQFDKLHAAMVLVVLRWERILGSDAECFITSANDSQHMKGSRHYDGRALDFRTHSIPARLLTSKVHELRTALGPQFDVVLESDHLHVEFNGQ